MLISDPFVARPFDLRQPTGPNLQKPGYTTGGQVMTTTSKVIFDKETEEEYAKRLSSLDL